MGNGCTPRGGSRRLRRASSSKANPWALSTNRIFRTASPTCTTLGASRIPSGMRSPTCTSASILPAKALRSFAVHLALTIPESSFASPTRTRCSTSSSHGSNESNLRRAARVSRRELIPDKSQRLSRTRAASRLGAGSISRNTSVSTRLALRTNPTALPLEF